MHSKNMMVSGFSAVSITADFSLDKGFLPSIEKVDFLHESCTGFGVRSFSRRFRKRLRKKLFFFLREAQKK